MIEKLKRPVKIGGTTFREKINELVVAVNKLETVAKNTNTVLESLVEENNIHEKQIDELQMKVEPEKCETPVDPYAEQRNYDVYVKNRHLIGKLCKFKFGAGYTYGILTNIKRKPSQWAFESNGRAFSYCEPVKPTDSIIYKGNDNEK